MPQNQRLLVWRGELKKTSGGLTKDMLMKNKRGKIVSTKKSQAAKKSDENNLGSWLRSKGDKFGGEPKALKAEDKKPKVVNAPKKVVNAIKKMVNAKPKVVNAKPKVVNAKPKVVKAPKKKLVLRLGKKPNARPARPKAEPMKAGEKTELGKISVGNILVKGKEQLNPYELKQKYLKTARLYKKKLGKSKEWVINKLGPLPSGITWGSIF